MTFLYRSVHATFNKIIAFFCKSTHVQAGFIFCITICIDFTQLFGTASLLKFRTHTRAILTSVTVTAFYIFATLDSRTLDEIFIDTHSTYTSIACIAKFNFHRVTRQIGIESLTIIVVCTLVSLIETNTVTSIVIIQHIDTFIAVTTIIITLTVRKCRTIETLRPPHFKFYMPVCIFADFIIFTYPISTISVCTTIRRILACMFKVFIRTDL